MRISEAAIAHYCDFCKEERVKADASCGVCGKDVCRRHEFEVAIPKVRMTEPPRTRVSESQPTFRVPTFVILEPVCTECASSTPLAELVAVLSQNRTSIESRFGSR